MTDRPAGRALRVAMLTREYPPEIYGGAGVHVEYLARSLAPLVDVTVHWQTTSRATGAPGRPDGPGPVAPGQVASGQAGAQQAGPAQVAHRPWDLLAGANPALGVISTDLAMTAATGGADLVHSHTWYANMAGHLSSLLYSVPHVMTMHSLEPLRPWKAEQLGGGYALSSWCERTAIQSAAAVIAVSNGMAADIRVTYPEVAADRVHVIHNGIDASQYSPDHGRDVLDRFGIDPSEPSVVFVGRVTRQKGLPVLLRAAEWIDPSAQLVLCAGQADTAELQAEVTGLVERLRATRSGVIWLAGMLQRAEVIQILSHATVFACPSEYEPLGIVNLEAMACGSAVVASAVGGIPEVVADGRTGLLVPPGDEVALAEAINALIRAPARAAEFGARGRARAVAEFSWDQIAAQTAELYAGLVPG
jgi:alpha-maltose-1-phosphate synthase